MDENLEVPQREREIFLNNTVYNVTEFFANGTDDDHIIEWLRDSKYVLVTMDKLMTIKALMNEVPVLYVDNVNKKTKLIDVYHRQLFQYNDIQKYIIRKLW